MSNHTLPPSRQFASDNYAGVIPEVMRALEKANRDHACSYGNDAWTRKATRLLQKIFKTDCKVFFVFNGTAANSLAAASICDSFHNVICHEFAHINTDECGAPGFFAQGMTMAPIPGTNGKLTPSTIEKEFHRRTDVHHPKSRMLSVTQATELGMVYSIRELKAITQTARKLGLRIHMDGARFSNAVASLKTTPAEITWKAGVDVLTLGGTKSGMIFGEAVIFFNHELAKDFEFRRKQSGQLSSKMRFLAAQWLGWLQDDTWLRYATHANHIAASLEKALKSIPSVRIMFPRQANSVFVEMPTSMVNALHRRGWHFYTDVGPNGYARFMCSWDSTKEDVVALVKDIKRLSRKA